MGDRLLGQKGDINSKTLEKYSQRIPEYGTVPSSSIIKPYSQVVEPYTKGELDPAALAAVERGEIVEKTPDTALKRFNSISDVNPTIYDAFLNTRNALPQRADKNQATLRNLSNSSYAQVVSQEPKVTFNDLVTVAYIPLEGKGRRTDKLKGYRTEEQQIATLQDLAQEFSSCLVAQVNNRADLENIQTKIDEALLTTNTIIQSREILRERGQDPCKYYFSKDIARQLDTYYYGKSIKMTYLGYAVNLAIAKFTEKYNSIMQKMFRSARDYYTYFMTPFWRLLGYNMETGGRRTRRNKRSRKSIKRSRKSIKRRSSKKTKRRNSSRRN
jgi:hypothetical protein